MLNDNGIIAFGKAFPSKYRNRIMEWFTYSDGSFDKKITKAYILYESPPLDPMKQGELKDSKKRTLMYMPKKFLQKAGGTDENITDICI